jgi:hypothetical protein
VSHEFKTIRYESLNSRQRENFNFQKLAGHLADYGFYCMRLSDDWMGADLIACHTDGKTILRVQLKSRLTLDRKYVGKALYIACTDPRRPEDWFVYPHDEVMSFAAPHIANSVALKEKGIHSWYAVPSYLSNAIEKYRVPAAPSLGKARASGKANNKGAADASSGRVS